MEPYPSEPLCLPSNFIWDSQNRKLQVDKYKPRGDITVCKEGLAILDSVKDDYVVVICITGPARTGKSYFLSQFQEGVTFEIGHSTTSKTTGIWIALAPNSITVNGKVARLVLLDAEGLGSTSTNDHDGSIEMWDRKVFTLCALFTSYLIYNSKGVPTNDDIEKLSFMSQFSSSIRGHLSTPGESTETAVDISPYFMWLIRDAVLQPDVDGQSCTWKQFILSSVLCVEAGAAKNRRNAIKAAIKRSFQNFDAHGIPPPSVDPEVVQNLLLANYKDQINKKFLHRVEEVKNHVLACAQVKVIKGFHITGQQLALYVSSCVTAVNRHSDKLPIQNAWESFLEVKWNDTLIATMEKYDDHAKQINFPISTENIESFHVKESSEVQKAFTKFEAQNFDETSMKQYREKLTSALKEKLHTIKTINKTKSHSHCENVARQLELRFTTKVENLDNYTFEELLEGRQKVLEEYLQEAIGPSINEVKEALEERMDGKIKTFQPALIQNTIEAVEKVYEREARDTIQDRLPLATNVIDAEHQRIRKLCVNKFQKRCRGCDGFSNALSRLETYLRKWLQPLQNTNLSLSNDACEEAMRSSKRRHFDTLWNSVSKLKFADLQRAKETALAEYERNARGPAKDNVKRKYEEDMDKKLCQSKKIIAENALTEAKRGYKRELDELLKEGPLDSQEASVKCSSICTKSRKHFKRRCHGLGNVLTGVYSTEARKVESHNLKSFHRRNKELSFEYCDKLMTKLIREILMPSIDSNEIVVSYDEKKTSILQRYDERAKGPKAVDVRDDAVLQIDRDIERAKKQRVLKGIKIGFQFLEVGVGFSGAAFPGQAAKIAMTVMAAKVGETVIDKTM